MTDTPDSNSNQDRGKGGDHSHKYHYIVDGEIYETDQSALTGAQIKAALPNFDPTYQLVEEGQGNDADKVINDTDTVDLKPHTPRFYTVPVATFG